MNLEMLMRRHYAAIYRLALSILDDPDEADDAVQETFVQAARAAESFRGEADVKTWLYRIAVNTCRGHLRRRRSRRALQAALNGLAALIGSTNQDPESSVIRDENEVRLWAAVKGLGEKHALPLLLRYVHELTVPEIAAVLDLPEGTVHSRLHRSRRLLRARLKSGLPDLRERSEP